METLTFASADKEHTINAVVFGDLSVEPKGIVQIVHGMAEYILRYADFAAFLNENGYIVCGHDHVGHGMSVTDKSEWGHITIEGGDKVLVEDTHTLRNIMQQRYEALPYFIFGHSMGSFVLRAYLACYGAGLSGAIICGTGNTPVATSKAGNKLCHVLARLRGQTHRSKLVDGMAAGGYGKMIEGATGPYDWLSHNKENVAAYTEDEKCGYMFSVGGYAAVTALTAEVARPECAAAYPTDVALLYIAGEEDPVGDFGKGVKEAHQLAADAKVADTSCIIYEGMRHEILNENGNEKVYEDVLAWLGQHL